MLRLVAAGFPSWYSQMINHYLLLKRKHVFTEIDDITVSHSLGFPEFADIFFLYQFGVGIAVIVFIIENLVYKYFV